MTLIKKELKSQWKIMLVFMLVLTMYSAIIIAMYDPQLGESLHMMKEAMPQLFAAFGMSDPGLTLLDFLTNYLYGFIFIVFPFLYVIIMCYRLMCRYIDKGSMAYLLATPHSRLSIVLSQYIVLILGITFLITYTTVFIELCSKLMYGENIPIASFIRLNLGLLSLHIFLGSMCYLTACCFDEMKYSLGIGAGLGIFFILLQMLSNVHEKIEFLKYLTPLTLFHAQGLIAFDLSAIFFLLVFIFMSFVMLFITCIIFRKRDLSL